MRKTLLSHHMEELKAFTCSILNSATTNIKNERIATAGSHVLGDQMTHGLVGFRLSTLDLLDFNESSTQWPPF